MEDEIEKNELEDQCNERLREIEQFINGKYNK